MAVTPKNVINKALATGPTTEYTATNCRAIIDKMTVTNTSAANVTFGVNIVPNGGAAGTDNYVIIARAVAPGETYTCPEAVGQALNPGDFIVSRASTGAVLAMVAAVREIT